MNPLNPLYFAVAWLMMRIHSGLSLVVSSTSGVAWVLTIVMLVVLMRMIMVPLFVKQMHSMRKMSALAPQLQELRKKYKNDKQTLNEETMRLYRENGVNPLGGCLPVLGQMPMFFALFSVLRAISGWKTGQPLKYGLTESAVRSAQHADIFGARISDKFLFSATTPTHARVVIAFTVLISVVTTFLTVRQSTKRGMSPQQMTPDNPMAQSQKYMAYIVPFFALSGLYWAFGLVLYWVTTNVWTLGQGYVLFKRYPIVTAGAAPGGAAAVAGAGGKAGTAAPKRAPLAPKQGPAGSPQTARKPPAAQGSRKPPAGQGSGKPSAGAPGGKAKPSQGAAKPSAGVPASAAGQQSSSNGSGVLRRLGRGRAQPEPEPERHEVKLVRQQRVRQSRSKRSGKR